jgi:hypothetical protein
MPLTEATDDSRLYASPVSSVGLEMFKYFCAEADGSLFFGSFDEGSAGVVFAGDVFATGFNSPKFSIGPNFEDISWSF